jgi:WD40 repeat protein
LQPIDEDNGYKVALVGQLEMTGAVRGLSFSPVSGELAIGSGSIEIWRLPERILVRKIGELWGGDIAFSSDGQLIAAVARDGSIGVWRALNGALIQSLRLPQWPTHIAISRDGSRVAAISEHRDAAVWRVADGILLETVKGADNLVRNSFIRFSPNDVAQIIGETDSWSGVGIWNVAGQKQVTDFEKPDDEKNGVSEVAFSPDGQVLAAAYGFGNIHLWNLASGQKLRSIGPVGSEITALIFSPKGDLVVAGYADHWVRVWRLSDGKNLQVLKGHTSEVQNLAFSSDGKLLATASGDVMVRLWGVR